jgi:hypothetical protein
VQVLSCQQLAMFPFVLCCQLLWFRSTAHPKPMTKHDLFHSLHTRYGYYFFCRREKTKYGAPSG